MHLKTCSGAAGTNLERFSLKIIPNPNSTNYSSDIMETNSV
jgi:hypothetical protein